MEKVTILFGAGAEKSPPFDIDGGMEFARKVIGMDTEVMDNAIQKYYSSLELSSWYPEYSKQFIPEEKLIRAAVKKEILKHNEDISKKIYEDAVKERVDKYKKDENLKKTALEEYTSYMGVLDEKFHTIISPKALGPRKFWNVITCYTRAYLTVVKAVLGNDCNHEEKGYLEILNEPNDTYNKLVSTARSKEKLSSYYSLLRKKKTELDIKVITTNYTPLCQTIADLNDDSIAYVHGKIGWFESPYTLQVCDIRECKSLPKDDLWFPYIFLQSGIKPIVDFVQLREYRKMLDFLEDAERIIVLGYRANIDDNHINGILHHYIKAGKEVIYLDFDNQTKESVLSQFRIVSDEDNFVLKSINPENCMEVFERSLEGD